MRSFWDALLIITCFLIFSGSAAISNMDTITIKVSSVSNESFMKSNKKVEGSLYSSKEESEKEENTSNSRIAPSNNFKHKKSKTRYLLSDKQDGLTKADNFLNAKKRLDAQNLNIELNKYLKVNFKAKAFAISEQNNDYEVYFQIKRLIYDDLTGDPYAETVIYWIEKDGRVLFKNLYRPKKNKSLLGREFTKLLKSKEIAAVIANDMLKNYFNKKK
jgi:hypothetical protein